MYCFNRNFITIIKSNLELDEAGVNFLNIEISCSVGSFRAIIVNTIVSNLNY
jgi:hypothetical protein